MKHLKDALLETRIGKLIQKYQEALWLLLFTFLMMIGMPVEFWLFFCMVVLIAFHGDMYHDRMKTIISTGTLFLLCVYKMKHGFTFHHNITEPSIKLYWVTGLWEHLRHEWLIPITMLAVLPIYTLLSDQFEETNVSYWILRFLGRTWIAIFIILVAGAALSAVIDNVGAGSIQSVTLIALCGNIQFVINELIVAVATGANIGGEGSIVGDGTSIAANLGGVTPWQIFQAYTGGIVALLYFGPIVALKQQQKLDSMTQDDKEFAKHADAKLVWPNIFVVFGTILAAIAVNLYICLTNQKLFASFPWLVSTLLVGIIIGSRWCTPAFKWHKAWKSFIEEGLFIGAIVFMASMLPFEDFMPLPTALNSLWVLGYPSSFIDNMAMVMAPIKQIALYNHSDLWAIAIHDLGVGGSFTPIASGVCVLLAAKFKQMKNFGTWMKASLHPFIGFTLGHFALMLQRWNTSITWFIICLFAIVMLGIVPRHPRWKPHRRHH